MTMDERVSALADGQLDEHELAQLLDQLAHDDASGDSSLIVQWEVMHLVGDVIRFGSHLPCTASANFLEGLRARLAQESAVSGQAIPELQSAPVHASGSDQATNEPFFHWRMVAGVAALATVAAMGWNWIDADVGRQRMEVADSSSNAAVRSLASLPADSPAVEPTWRATRVVIGSGPPQTVLRDARLDEMLAAHQQLAGTAPMPSAFLRSAAFDGAGR